jgi:glycosyltransferase involved in cell wall biosynthesis
MAILEAMSDGRPVVEAPVGGIPDVIAHEHERDGLLVHLGDQAALRGVMARSAWDAALRPSLGSAARVKAESLNVARYSERLCGLTALSSCSNP